MRRHAHHPFSSIKLLGILAIFLLLSMMSVVVTASSSSTTPTIQQYIYSYQNTDALNNPELVSKFYRQRGFQPAWGESTQAHLRSASLLRILRGSHREGLVYAGYTVSAIESYRYSMEEKHIAWFDVLLTDAFLSYVKHAGSGQVNPYQLQENWHYPLPTVDALEVLKRVLITGKVAEELGKLSPQHGSYRRLVNALAEYTSIKQNGGWPQVPLHGPPLKLGDQAEEIITLKQRLRISGDLAGNTSIDSVFDASLQAAIKRFQARYGLEENGIVGENTRFALHAPVEKRIQQIIVNLERWRWLPRDLGKRHIRVNTARYDLRAYDNDQSVLSMRVVVGETAHKTPAFSKALRYLVLNPYWNIPNDIARDELIPSEQTNPGHLSRLKIHVLSGSRKINPLKINWQRYNGRKKLPIRLRQDPGPRNALGRIKFMLPNKYNIYLHDTTTRTFFDSRERTFSHGCVRVEYPLMLADYVLGDKWSYQDIQRAIKSGKTRRINLPESIPVHLYYHTVWVNDDGKVNFRKDTYRNDHLIMTRMPSARPVTEKVFIVSDDRVPVT